MAIAAFGLVYCSVCPWGPLCLLHSLVSIIKSLSVCGQTPITTQNLSKLLLFPLTITMQTRTFDYICLNFKPSLDSEDDFCSGCQNVSHSQQSFSGLLSTGDQIPLWYVTPGFKPSSIECTLTKCSNTMLLYAHLFSMLNISIKQIFHGS